MNRRDFIRDFGVYAATGLALPAVSFANNFNLSPSNDRILVLLELQGGNDGLNTVIPYRDQSYYQQRKKLAIANDAVIKLTDRVGLNPALKALLPLWQDNQLAIIQGVGYPQPNRSHFRSIEIWETASNSQQYLTEGWLSQPLHLMPQSQRAFADGVVIGKNGANLSANSLTGNGIHTLAIKSPEQFIKNQQYIQQLLTDQQGNAALNHLLQVNDHIRQSYSSLKASNIKQSIIETNFSKKAISQDFKNIAKIIATGLKVPVYKVSHGSFDTHSNQRNKQNRLLQEMAEGLASFRRAMQELGLWDKVLVMSYSEFGRRVAENASGGTDHGTAAPHFMMGGKVKGGIYGDQPSLINLDNGDLKYTTDFRSLYNTVIEQWWQLPSPTYANGFKAISCVSS